MRKPATNKSVYQLGGSPKDSIMAPTPIRPDHPAGDARSTRISCCRTSQFVKPGSWISFRLVVVRIERREGFRSSVKRRLTVSQVSNGQQLEIGTLHVTIPNLKYLSNEPWQAVIPQSVHPSAVMEERNKHKPAQHNRRVIGCGSTTNETCYDCHCAR